MKALRPDSDTLARPARRSPVLLGGIGGGLCAILLALLLAPACGSDDEDAPAGGSPMTPSPMDLGVPDAGADGGAPDAGAPDASAGFDAGYYCTSNEMETVEGVSVPVPEASERPTTRLPSGADGPPSLGCINQREPGAPRTGAVCLVQCLELFGYTPTQEEIDALELDAFELEVSGGVVDPSFDFATYQERSPSRVLDVNWSVNRTDSPRCESQLQIEVGFPVTGQTSDPLANDVRYVLRLRNREGSSFGPSGGWVPTYLWNFIRRLDERNDLGATCTPEQQEGPPETALQVPVMPRSKLLELLQATTATTPDLTNGQGPGYALVETRDCTFSGSLIAHLTVGMTPSPSADGYLTEDGESLEPGAMSTTARGLYVALGLGSATSSAAVDTRAAIGVNRDGACTEALGGIRFPVYPDSVTFVRSNRETTLLRSP